MLLPFCQKKRDFACLFDLFAKLGYGLNLVSQLIFLEVVQEE